jgi:F0F1-type ATP synthase membrane subunit c/vacuolar-type H+-ATPase subunit K
VYKTKKLLVFTFLLFLVSFYLPVGASSSDLTSSGVGLTIPITGEAETGDIICAYRDGFSLCNQEYDLFIYGVISDTPAISLTDDEIENPRTVVSAGITRVKVSGVNGAINEGDYVTSSNVSGVGQLAAKSGSVLGKAMQDFDPSSPDDTEIIQVVIGVKVVTGISGSRSNLMDFLREGMTVPVFEPVDSLRYLLAILIVLTGFTLGIVYFGRMSTKGVEAVGRNPVAKRVIQFNILLSVVLTIVIIGVGLAIAYLILIL